MRMRRYIKTVLIIIFLLGGSYPVWSADEYWSTSKAPYEERKKMFLEFHINEGPKEGLTGIFSQISRWELGLQPEEDYIEKAIQSIRMNRDCNDFTVNGLLRLVYLDKSKHTLSENISQQIDDCLLDFKYWWDDGRQDSTYRCYHTENHQALYHTAELLAGQLYKDRIFTNGMTGKQHIEHATERLERWLDYRFRFGFSEWLSSYYDVEVMLLCNLYDFAEDEKIRHRAGLVLDVLMFDMALNNFHGMLGTTSGRIYVSSLIYGSHDMSPVLKLVFGEGVYLTNSLMGPSALTTSSYRCPEVIKEIAVDYSTPMLNRQRLSLNVENAPEYGLSYDNELDCHLFWGMQEFIHPLSIRMSKQISEKYDTWPYKNYDEYIGKYEKQIEEHGKIVDAHLDRFALSEANIEAYRTPDYMLSCVQDYRKAAPGYQQHIWQATIDNQALVYTNHPGSKNLRSSPNYWAGNPYMPRAAQYKNVIVCIYNTPLSDENHSSHAYFPKDAFEEAETKGHWTFGRKGNAYIALYSANPVIWKTDEEGKINDLYAQGRQNIWVCEMGTQKEWGTFQNFMDAISGAVISKDGLNISYHSPSISEIRYGWDIPLTIQGQEISQRYEYRYDNPYCKTVFDTRKLEIKKGKKSWTLDFDKGIRKH